MDKTRMPRLVHSRSKLVKYEYSNLQRVRKLSSDNPNKISIIKLWELELHKQKLAIQMDMSCPFTR